MRLIDADAFKEYITEACEDLAPLFNDNGKVARLVTENFCKDIDEQPTIHLEPHWIPCSGGLPKEEGFYLVTLEDKCGAETTIRFFRIENGERHWSLWGNENITAWMPKPEPYKGVTE